MTRGELVVRVLRSGNLVVDIYRRSPVHQELALVAPEIPVRRGDAAWALPELIRAIDGRDFPPREEHDKSNSL